MSEKLAFRELIQALEARARLGNVCGLSDDVARAEIRYWNITGHWFDNTMACPFYSKGNALDGFCAHHPAEYATRQLQGDTVEVLWCGDCQREIGEIGYDFPRQTNNRHETPELVEMEF